MIKLIFFYSSIFVLISCPIFAQKFVIPVLPDTQKEINYNPDMFVSQMEWIASQKDSLNIPIVFHVGDVVDFNNDDQYIKASDGFKILDNEKIAYAITLGNHDTGLVQEYSSSAAPGNLNKNLRMTDKFNAYFPIKRFILQKGRFESGKSDNAYYTFEAGGLKWLVLTLEFCARPTAINWASKIISGHSKYNVIILTHYHLLPNGDVATNAEYGDLSPLRIYNELIRKYSNILLVLSGHVDSSAYKDDLGEHGNHIYQLLQDYQGENYGGGYIRLLEIDPKQKKISAKMYSPYYKKARKDDSQITFTDVSFVL